MAEEEMNVNAKSKVARDILYITSHQSWQSIFSPYILQDISPAKKLSLCVTRTQLPKTLLPLQAELLKFGVEKATLKAGPLYLSKKRPRPGMRDPLVSKEMIVIDDYIRQLKDN